MNSRNLFYIRYLQLRYNESKKPLTQALFFLEKSLFDFAKNVNEDLIVQIKLKWLIEEIKKENLNNPIVKNFDFSVNSKLKMGLINLINQFSKILNSKTEFCLMNEFKKFNNEFNLILENGCEKKIKTSYFFQTMFFVYDCKLNKKFNIFFLEDLFKLMEKNKFDKFELSFLECFFEKKNIKAYKVKKMHILFKLLKKFLNDW